MFRILNISLFKPYYHNNFDDYSLKELDFSFLRKINTIFYATIIFLVIVNPAFSKNGANNKREAVLVHNHKQSSKYLNNHKKKTTKSLNKTTRGPGLSIKEGMGLISTCLGFPSVNPNLCQYTISGYGLTEDLSVTVSSGFEVSLSPDEGFSQSLSIPLASDSVPDTKVYIRAGATVPIGVTDGLFVMSSTSIQLPVNFPCVIYDLPKVNQLDNLEVNARDSVKGINFGGTGTSYDWTCDNPNIGLSNAGGANLPSFKAINNTKTPITATITVKPRFSLPGLAYIPNYSDGKISVINTVTDSLYATISDVFYPDFSVISPDNSTLYLNHVTKDNLPIISAIDLASNKVVKSFSATNTASNTGSLAISADGKLLYKAVNFIDGETNYVSVINVADTTIMANIKLGNNNPILGLTLSHDGKKLFVLIDTVNAKDHSYMVAINTSTYKIIDSIEVGRSPSSVSISPDNSKAYVLNYADNYLSVINAVSDTVIKEIKLDYSYDRGVLSPDGNRFYAVNISATGCNLSLLNTATNQIVNSINLGINSESGLSISKDGKYIYIIDSGGNFLKIIDALNLVVVNTIKGYFNSPWVTGNFVTSTDYYGTPSSFTITVNPVNPVLTTSNVTGNITSCQGAPSASPNIEKFIISGHSLTDNVVITAPTGFEISVSEGSNYANNLTLVKTADSVTKTVIYVRSSSNAPIGVLNTIILVSSTGASSVSIPVIATISPLLNPTINISSSFSSICSGTDVAFNASVTNGGTSPTYQWQLNGNNVGTNSPNFSTNTLNDGDLITCVLKSNIACLAQPTIISNSLTIKVGSPPTVSAGGDKVVKKGLSTVLNASATGDITDITWSPIEGLSNYKILNPTASPLTTTIYTITVVTSSGCSTTSSAKVSVVNSNFVISIPNAFSPNNDGINDTWNIKDIEGYPNCTVDIFNRYGTKVYSSRGYGVAWDGRYNHSDLPVGTYYYIINLNDGSSTISGYVALIR